MNVKIEILKELMTLLRDLSSDDEIQRDDGDSTGYGPKFRPEIPSPYMPGTSWVFRTVTHYTVGIVRGVIGTSIVLEPGSCWVASTGRWSEFLRDGWTAATEVEPHPAIW